MTRFLLAWLLFLTQVQAAWLQEPAEEDTTGERKVEYGFNPLQAEKEIKVARYYLKKGSHRAAQRRFEEALKWDPSSAAAHVGLAEAQSRSGDRKAARETYLRYIEKHPDTKDAVEMRKKLQEEEKK